MAARGFLGAGDLYIARFNETTQAFGGFTGPFEASSFEIQPNVELLEMQSRGRDTYGQVIESVPLPQPSDFTLVLSEVNRQALTMALMGAESTINQASGTWTAASITIGQKGEWFDLGSQNVAAAGFSLTNVGATVTYVLGTDYEINYRMGWIKVLPGSVIAHGASLRVTGTFGAVGGTLIRGAVSNQVRARFRLDGVNFVDKSPVEVDVHEAVLSPESAFDFLSNEFASITLTGRLKTPVGRNEPFTVKLLNPA